MPQFGTSASGFSLNAPDSSPTGGADLRRAGQRGLDGKTYVIDTSRNGNGPARQAIAELVQPEGPKLGVKPTTDSGANRQRACRRSSTRARATATAAPASKSGQRWNADSPPSWSRLLWAVDGCADHSDRVVQRPLIGRPLSPAEVVDSPSSCRARIVPAAVATGNTTTPTKGIESSRNVGTPRPEHPEAPLPHRCPAAAQRSARHAAPTASRPARWRAASRRTAAETTAATIAPTTGIRPTSKNTTAPTAEAAISPTDCRRARARDRRTTGSSDAAGGSGRTRGPRLGDLVVERASPG